MVDARSSRERMTQDVHAYRAGLIEGAPERYPNATAMVRILDAEAVLLELSTMRDALVDLRNAADLYHSGTIGFEEFAQSMDKAYAALYPHKKDADNG